MADMYDHTMSAWGKLHRLAIEIERAGLGPKEFLRSHPREIYKAAKRAKRIAKQIVEDLQKATRAD